MSAATRYRCTHPHQMLSTGRSHLTDAWWLSTVPGVAILITSLAFNLLGDGLRDVLDPRSQS